MEKEDTISLIRSLLITENGLYDYVTFLRDFKKETGLDLPKFEYKTSLEFLRSLPDTVQVIRLKGRIFLEYVDNLKTSHLRSLITRQGTCRKEKLKISSHDDLDKETSHDFSESHVPIGNKLEEYSNKRLDVCNMKCNNNNSNNNNIGFDNNLLNSDVIVSSGECDQSEEWYCDEMNTEDNLFSTPNLESLSLETKQPESSFNELEENCPIYQDWEIPKLNLREHIKIGEYIEVCIIATYNPFKFSFLLKKFKKKFIKLMEEMQYFYNELGKSYKIGNLVLKKNDPCAVLHKFNDDLLQWHRAEIITFEENFSRVLFVDCGIVMEIDNSNLWFLCGSFGELPAQALMGHLANIKPCNGNNWPKQTNQRFQELVCKKDLIAGVVDVNCEKFWVSMALSETGEEGIHINDTLVAENLAAFDFSDLDEGNSSMLGTNNEDANENNTKLTVLSYSEDNKKLREMFKNAKKNLGNVESLH